MKKILFLVCVVALFVLSGCDSNTYSEDCFSEICEDRGGEFKSFKGLGMTVAHIKCVDSEGKTFKVKGTIYKQCAK